MIERHERVAVTGVGVVCALGVGARQSFARLLRGERGFGPVTLFPTDGLRSRIAAQVSDLDFEGLAGAPELSRTDRLALAAGREAIGDARLTPEPGDLGLVFGGTVGAMFETEEGLLRLGGVEPSARQAKGLVTYPLSRTLSTLEERFGRLSCAATVCSACSSGATAIVQGAHWIQSGKAKAVLAGGADGLCRMTFAGFNALGAVDPEPCRPFDVQRGGLSLGEAAAFLLLESESMARTRGAKVLAWLSGWAIGAEAHHGAHPEPSGRRAAELMQAAIESAGLTAPEIDYVNAHGTATLQNDVMEAAALRLALGADVSRIAVSSIKGQLGHTLGAAGALEAALSVLALENAVVPATVGLTEPEDPGLLHVIGAPRFGPVRALLSNSFGFGGMDAALLFEARDARPRSAPRARSELVVTGFAESRPDLDPHAVLDPQRSRRFDRLAAETTRTAQAALRSAGLGAESVGLVLGNAYGNVQRSTDFLNRLLFRGLRYAPPAEFPHLLHSAPAGHASIYLGLNGPVFAVVERELGAEVALGSAAALLGLGVATAVLAGAVEALDPIVQELSPRQNGSPRGEGGGFLVLEPLAAATERGASVLCRLASYGEERGTPESAPELVTPMDAARARVLLCGDLTVLLERIRATPWEKVARLVVPPEGAAYHEAIGARALIDALLLIGSGQVDEVLIVTGGVARRFLVRFCRPELSR